MNWRLEASRDDLLIALKRLAKVIKKTSKEQADLSFNGQVLIIEACGCECEIPGSGSWPARVLFPAPTILPIAHTPPRDDPVVFAIHDGRFAFAGITIPCEIREDLKLAYRLPLSATWQDALVYGAVTPEAALEGTGCAGEVEAARSRLDHLLEPVARALKPTGVTPEDLRSSILDLIARRAQETN